MDDTNEKKEGVYGENVGKGSVNEESEIRKKVVEESEVKEEPPKKTTSE